MCSFIRMKIMIFLRYIVIYTEIFVDLFILILFNYWFLVVFTVIIVELYHLDRQRTYVYKYVLRPSHDPSFTKKMLNSIMRYMLIYFSLNNIRFVNIFLGICFYIYLQKYMKDCFYSFPRRRTSPQRLSTLLCICM